MMDQYVRVDKWNVIWWVSVWHGTEVQMRDLRWMSVGYVGYTCISCSLNCALGCVGTPRAKTSGVDLHARKCTFVLCGKMPMWQWQHGRWG